MPIGQIGENHAAGKILIGTAVHGAILQRIGAAAARSPAQSKPTSAPAVPDIVLGGLHRPKDLAGVHAQGHDRVRGRRGRLRKRIAGGDVNGPPLGIDGRRIPHTRARWSHDIFPQ